MNPTKLLRETVVKWARENDHDSETVMENTVVLPKLPMETPGGVLELDLFILDRNPQWPFLAILAHDLVRFPEDQTDRALDMCDRLNRAGLGKFTTLKEPADADLMIVYAVECPISDGVYAAVFTQTIEAGINWLKAAYPALLLVRWGEMSVERAFNVWRGKEDITDILAEAEEDDDGSIMTDEDIRRLMGEG